MSSRPWYGFAGFLLAAIMFASAPAHADDVTTYPTVVITGTFVTSDGYVINCFTTSCQNLEVSLQMMYSKMYSDISQGNGGSNVSKEVFCANLAEGEPPGCNYSNPPSAPGFDPGWVGNGCGSGDFASAIANELASHIISGYEGNLDFPLPGVSFFASCQSHDFCYATSTAGRADCDSDFKSSLSNTCVNSGGYQSTCAQIVDYYYTAVRVAGESKYNTAHAETACAGWAYEMEANQCEPSA